ncbi:hypothetical protein MNV49_003071 [Pseudohyphozyma bogoriensis]|nr:hypothetical protein MNV49_003071 [Pseudohyphozyma bogoriensis]
MEFTHLPWRKPKWDDDDDLDKGWVIPFEHKQLRVYLLNLTFRNLDRNFYAVTDSLIQSCSNQTPDPLHPDSHLPAAVLTQILAISSSSPSSSSSCPFIREQFVTAVSQAMGEKLEEGNVVKVSLMYLLWAAGWLPDPARKDWEVATAECLRRDESANEWLGKTEKVARELLDQYGTNCSADVYKPKTRKDGMLYTSNRQNGGFYTPAPQEDDQSASDDEDNGLRDWF